MMFRLSVRHELSFIHKKGSTTSTTKVWRVEVGSLQTLRRFMFGTQVEPRTLIKRLTARTQKINRCLSMRCFIMFNILMKPELLKPHETAKQKPLWSKISGGSSMDSGNLTALFCQIFA